jgi:hypothetical protein
MLGWATRPVANLGLLLGLALAFLEVKEGVAEAPGGLLSEEGRVVLRAIVARERLGLEECVRELQRVDEAQYRRLVNGYWFGRGALERYLA